VREGGEGEGRATRREDINREKGRRGNDITVGRAGGLRKGVCEAKERRKELKLTRA
jgi:hypothetical protein